ncbi:MurR/RpiR family transcriptional regulator [Streptomyces asiaticus]
MRGVALVAERDDPRHAGSLRGRSRDVGARRPAAADSPTEAQSRVVDVIVRNPQLASYADLADIAQRVDVNSSTVVRAAQALGYRGWPDLQRELRARYLVLISTEDKLTQSGEHRSPLHDALTHDIDNLRQTLDNNTAAEAEAAIATVAATKSILVLGAGSFAGPASVMAHLGSTMGYPISLENRGGVHLASAVNSLGPGDALVVVNLWRSMKQIIVAAEAAREAGAAVVAITDMRRGRLATTVAEHLLIVPSEGISFFQSVTAPPRWSTVCWPECRRLSRSAAGRPSAAPNSCGRTWTSTWSRGAGHQTAPGTPSRHPASFGLPYQKASRARPCPTRALPDTVPQARRPCRRRGEGRPATRPRRRPSSTPHPSGAEIIALGPRPPPHETSSRATSRPSSPPPSLLPTPLRQELS